MLSERINKLSADYATGADLSEEEVGELLDYIFLQHRSIKRLNKAVAQLNASNQTLAQTIKDMDAGYGRNRERFVEISRRAQKILDWERLNGITENRLRRIQERALEGAKEEGDHATVPGR